jgi:hypothetical protein
LDFSVANKVLSWGTINEYWNQVYTDGRKEWVLNSKKDATAINPSIDEALKHQTGKGIYSYSPKSTILNTVFLTKEGDDLYIYLKTQMKNETGYVKLKYSKNPRVESSAAILEAKKNYDVLASTLKELQIDLELEVETSEGSRNNSLFGTKREGEDLVDLAVLREEVSRIERLVRTIKDNQEILNKIKEKGIGGIRIINPYLSKNKPGIITGEPSRKILLLSIDQDSVSILALLSN